MLFDTVGEQTKIGEAMSPKEERCTMCGTLETTKWHMLDDKSVCADCHDVQLNPSYEPHGERSPERLPTGNMPEQQENDELLHEDDMELPAEHATMLPCTPEKMDAKKPQSGDEHVDVELSADLNNADEQDELHETITTLGMFSPRRLRHRVCPVPEPVRRGSKKNGRNCQGSRSKSRRTLTKKVPIKSPRETASTKTVSKVHDDNTWYQLGDIVSMVDAEDNTYYAQIRGLLVDAHNEKSAVLTWLLPTTASPPPNEAFDPATYLAGPDEDLPRRLTYMKFVMHAPSNYYLDRTNPYPRPECYGPSNTTQSDNRNYVWTSITSR
uniref:GATA zinc finger domain-containing protein 1 n=1 Tax=Anopheles stephensi TaxID=30069 RepID=A0A182Y729_ANOST